METIGVLARIVANRGLQPEPVATDALTHVLATSPAASGALTSLVATLAGDPSITSLGYSTQVLSSADNGKPDLVGADASGPRLICEAKFDAALTAAQLSTAYLDRLAPGQGGVLLYLVPEERVTALWPKLLAGPGGGAAVETPAVEGTLSVSARSAGLPDGRRLAVISWARLLDLLANGIDLAGDSRARGDLEQLAGLVAWRSRTGWLPTQPGDLTDTTGRQLASISEVVLSAASAASSGKVRNGSGDNGPGRWMQTPGGRWFWVGVWLKGWDRWGHGPVWVQVGAKSEASFVALTKALAALEHGVGPGRFRLGPKYWGTPLEVPAGLERDDAHASLVTQLTTLAALIDTAGIGVVTEEPEPAVEDHLSAPSQ